MGKPIFIILTSVLVVAGLVGVIFEVYKMSQDSILGFVKRDIVGDYDALYNEYFHRYYHAQGSYLFRLMALLNRLKLGSQETEI